MNIEVTASLGDLVAQDPRRSRILGDLGIDYCCNGHRTLEEAVVAAGLDVGEVAAALDLPADPAGAVRESTGRRPGGNSELAHEIVDTHHAYMWAEMPRIAELLAKVVSVHGDVHPELVEVQEVFTGALSDLEPHMTKEERSVFPAISRLERGGRAAAGGSLAEPIAALRREHEAIGRTLKRLRELTTGYTPPADACASYRALYSALAEMEHDLHVHIHKENNILFPSVLEAEADADAPATPA